MTFPVRQMYARITISAEAIQHAVARDRDLNRRMAAGGLSLKLAGKAWRRIRGARWGRIAAAEYAGIVRDLQDRERFWQDIGRPEGA